MGVMGRIGAAADWAERVRPRLPVLEAEEHPPWVVRALNDCLPGVLLLAVTGVLRLLDSAGAWLVFALFFGAFVLFFGVLPWLVTMGRSFAAGYRGDEETGGVATARPTGSDPRATGAQSS